MNGKKVACVVLMLFVGMVAYFGQIMHQKTLAKMSEAEAAKNEVVTAEGDIQVAEINVGKTKSAAADVISFLEAWRPHAEKFQTQLEVESAIQSSLRGTGLLIMSQKFESKEDKNNPVVPRVVRAALVIEDEYAKVLNWVGELERRFPLTRMMSCDITGGETGRLVHAEVAFEIPIVNLDADLTKEDPKAKAKKKAA
ncbi:MAG: hypothetical protein JNJ83_13340 [Verrucomicrobiaceae bacterium]|nr:hypothetical protein [Verrucomicrobiaceae bacterium]